jgi:hypothetical protein
MTKIEDKPKAGGKDVAHLAVRVVLSSIPGIGGAAKEIFNTVIAPPLAKRQTQWIESIASRLMELEEKVNDFKIEELSNNSNFISVVLYATQIAIRSHQEEKLEALHNAVLNVALSSLVQEDLQHIFLNFVDEFTPWHLKVLKYLDNPDGWFKNNKKTHPNIYMGGPILIMNNAFPELEKDPEFAHQLIRDLNARGLISADITTMNTMMSQSGMYSPRTTPLGKQFLDFIVSPIK